MDCSNCRLSLRCRPVTTVEPSAVRSPWRSQMKIIRKWPFWSVTFLVNGPTNETTKMCWTNLLNKSRQLRRHTKTPLNQPGVSPVLSDIRMTRSPQGRPPRKRLPVWWCQADDSPRHNPRWGILRFLPSYHHPVMNPTNKSSVNTAWKTLKNFINLCLKY